MVLQSKLSTVKRGADRYDITEDDLVWIVRGTHGEGLGSASGATPAERELEYVALVSCFVRRFMYLRKKNPSAWGSRTLGDLAQAHSQPINPSWLPGGTQYERYRNTTNPTTLRAISPEAVAARIRRRAAPLDSFPPSLVQLCRDVLTGARPLMSSGHDWGAVTLYDGTYGLDYSTKAQRDQTAARAVPARDNRRVGRGVTASYVPIDGQYKRGNVFSTFSDATYDASIVGGAQHKRKAVRGVVVGLLGATVFWAVREYL